MTPLDEATRIYSKNDALDDMGFEGSLEEIIQVNKKLELSSPATQRAFFPPRLVRATLNYAIETGMNGDRKYDLVSQTLTISTKIYQNKIEETKQNLEEFQSNTTDLATFNTIQKEDMKSWHAHHHSNIERTIRDIEYVSCDQPVYILGLSHGGLPPALTVHTVYDIERDSTLYTARLSASKKRDSWPKLTDYEKDVIQHEAKDKKVILLDEDIATGKTLMKAEQYLKQELGINNYGTVVYDHSYASWLKRSQTVLDIIHR